MLKRKFFLIPFIYLFFFNFAYSNEIKIIVKIDNELITNIDIENEKKYLLLLNENLNKLSKEENFILAKNSLIREKIKMKEINKFYKENDDIKFENKIIENFYKRLGFSNKNDFEKFVIKKKINFENLKKKLILEGVWNQIVYRKYKDKIKINKLQIKERIKKNYNSQEKKYEYNLSEILVDVEKNISFIENELLKYIKEFGFKIAANKYSKSDTSKYGGEIGWIKSASLSEKIRKKISSINIGEIAEVIQTPNGYLILKLNDKKEITEKLNLENELEMQVQFEQNRQLNQFSLNYYKKLKQNVNIYESK
tara:strand:- start:139 stop:1068 length:930 start_codon:yes stop_codon:yes gene_type:complete